MGVSSCTGPNCERGVQVCNAGWGLEMWGAPCELQYLRSNSKNLQVSASTEALTLEEYKYSASVQCEALAVSMVVVYGMP